MRMHRMRLEGIGPYAEPQDLDLDPLNDAGLFLLDGPTGAGKSTVLAALCFALYGSVPGGRTPESLVTTLRPPGAVVPQVLVEFTVQGRRFEVLRSPRHARPKKRGDGTTATQASVSLRERVDGAWTVPLTRADEVGQQVAEVLRLDAAQFMQVVSLPQGRFAEFLTARSDDRQRLLRRLFGTQRFDGVEDRLKERADALGTRVAADAAEAAGARAQLLEQARLELGEDWHAPDPAPEEGEDEWLVELTRTRADAALAEARTAQQAADAAEAAARAAQDRLTADTEALRALAAWEGREREHRQAADHVAADRSAVALHERASHVLGAATRAEQTRAAHASTAERARAAAEAVAADVLAAAWLDEAEDADAARRRADRETDALARAVRDRDALARLEAEGAQADAERERLEGEARAAREKGERRAAQIADLHDTVDAAAARLGAEDQVARRLAEATERAAAAGQAAERAVAQERARAARDERRDAQRGAAQARLDLLRSRFEQAAAELAAGLEDGSPCPVCGSAEHPDPAPRADGAVTEADVAAADRALEAADAALAEAEQALAAASEEHRAARERAGGQDVAAAEEALSAVRAEHEALAAARTALVADRRALARRESEQRTADGAATARTAALARLSEAQARRTERAAELTAAVAAAQGDAADLDARTAHVRTATRALSALVEAGDAAARAAAVAEDAAQALARALAEQDFADVAAARAAALPPDDAAARAARVRSWDVEEARLAEAAASEPLVRGRALREAGTSEPTAEEFAAAQETLREATAARTARAAVVGRREALVASLERQARRLRAVLERSSELLAEHERATGLLALVRGQGENRLKMPLASYVLAGRLEEVAAAATERLLAMTDRRYSIEYSDEATGRGNKGLELVIRDHYVDETRHPSTLSGGETFMASLALALGLADTVQAEAGGVELDTLFVDEGFGSLDADTLDDVLDVVDGLRAGGRTVGLVSHVERMKQEIPVRLEVTKSRAGSTLAIHDGG